MSRERKEDDARARGVNSLGDTIATDELQLARPGVPSVARESRRQRLAEQLFGVVEREPVRLGRFVLLDRLGEGGVGSVHIAYDPQLDRRVALKLLHPVQEASVSLRARMLREAQALARLSHPNVVPVHDAGVLDEQVFIVMEYVRGQTLRRWVEERRPSWGAVLNVYLQAGHGLAAAHRAGLIHRDFKPESRGPSPEHPQPADRSLSHGFGRSGQEGVPAAVPWGPSRPAAWEKTAGERPGEGWSWCARRRRATTRLAAAAARCRSTALGGYSNSTKRDSSRRRCSARASTAGSRPRREGMIMLSCASAAVQPGSTRTRRPSSTSSRQT